nr:cellulose synthase subunit BcsC-related outer membrane protein [uncultured Roseococcus sp.]
MMPHRSRKGARQDTRRSSAAYVAFAALLAATVPAQAQAPADVRTSGGSAANNLVEQAQFWQQQGHPERALQAYERLLAVEPNNLDALSGAVETAAVSNQTAAAQRHLQQFRRIAPQDARLTRLGDLVRLLNDDAEALAAARALAAAGRGAESVERYRQIFRDGRVPAALSSEYYQVLASSSEAGYREAVQALNRQVAAAPNDTRLALTYAQILTYREDTRAEGVDRLQQLARRPAMREPARQAWRQALLWLGDEAETAVRVQAYLSAFPGDRELEAKLQAAQGGIAPGPEARIVGWAEIDRRDYAEAERRFNAALALDENDAEAVLGLAVLRKIQNRMDEARRLLERAVALAPDRAAEFTRSVGDLRPYSTRATGTGGGYVSPPTAQGWRALQRGDLDAADRLARQGLSARGQQRLDAELILGQVALQRRDYGTAEARFRNALGLRPSLRDAQTGLYFALTGQGRIAEADALQREAGLTIAGAGEARAIVMRDRALLLDDPEARLEALRRALAQDPGNAWVRLDVVRQLRAMDRLDEARALQAQMEQETSADSSTAAALLAAEDERYGTVLTLLDRVPVRLRNSDTNRLLANARREAEVRQVEYQVREGRPGAREALLALAGRRDPSFASGPAAVRAFARLGDSYGAGLAARAALVANPMTTAQNRIDLASALLEADRMEDAAALANPLAADTSLPVETRRELARVMEQGAVQQADALNAREAPEEAYQALRPNLEAQPTSVPLNMALVRLYVGARRFAEARELVQAVLERDPRNLQARLALIDVATAEGNFREADALLTETAFFHPNDSQVLMAESRVARARGDYVRTLQVLERVAARRLDHLRQSGQIVEADQTARAFSPTRRGTTSGLTDRTSIQIAEELVRARDEAATWLQAGVQIQSRTGDAGLSRATTTVVPVEVSTPVPGIGGRVVVGLDTVSMNAGRLANNLAAGRQFGTNPLLPQSEFRRPNAAVDGAALRLTYLRNNFRADIGSTPLGFANPTVVGGVEVVPRINEQFRVRMTFERRAMTDSILSYAGQRERNWPTNWGGVVRTGGRVQLEYTPGGRWGAYAGVGGYSIDGQNVQSNKRIEASVGAYYNVLRNRNQSLTLGVGGFYTGYDHNLSGFTFGHGGYFSPQQSLQGQVQAEYIGHWGDWSFRTVGGAGYQAYRTSSSAVFPTNAAMQAQLEQAAALDSSLATRVAGYRSTGPTGSIFANLEYALTPNLRLGAAGRYERVGNWDEAAGFFYLRWRLDQPRADLQPFYDGAAYPRPNVNDPIQSSYRQGRPEWVQLPQGSTRPVW